MLVASAGFVETSNAMTLAEAATMPDGSEVTINEVVLINATPMTLSGTNLIQVRDDTRAVSLFASADLIDIETFLSGAQAGDVISFTATTQSYNGLFELTNMSEPATLLSTATIDTSLSPVPVIPSDFDDYSATAENLESRYVALQDIELFYGWPHLNQSASAGQSVAGETFQTNTTYVARDQYGNESIVWTRSQQSVDSLNDFFGTIPAGYFDLPGIFMQAFDGNEPGPGIAGINYLLNPVIVQLTGDLNNDGFVGLDDLDIILLNWNQTVTAGDLLAGDPSGDGYVGLDDLDLLLNHWNTGTPPNTSHTVDVPEPVAFLTWLLGSTICLKNKRHVRGIRN